MSFKSLTVEKIREAVEELLYKHEIAGTLPLTLKIAWNDTNFLVHFTNGSTTFYTGIGGFIKILNTEDDLHSYNLYVNNIFCIREYKINFIKKVKEYYANTSNCSG